MRIWVDADACPKVIKEILFRAANRTRTPLTLVSNHPLSSPPSVYITKIQVGAGFDVADEKIIEKLSAGDLVITADIPLADQAVTKGCAALNPRGEMYSPNNIKERLAIRNLSDGLRGSGMISGGPPTLSRKNIQDFSNQLDKFLTQKK
jgi:uncharacterized protein